ncbi:saccharopine dehydrogenase [candidate division TA06 bacterium DG_24]|uniref:Saccharopine dehydrogenase n=1 Tax=candidate division TA06 bacterium DG_24 TaxID=1703770 RepID=A0A0S7WN80_UNCT6|nr:MAG: saccharopine dehydrogenase [candidate division TA06 bacterium DG_24]
MQNVLVLGAGLVARPLVRYLLDQPDFHVKVASRTVSKADALIDGHERGESQALLISDADALKKLISEADLAISLVPYAHHVTIARLCIELGKPMITTSYVSQEMKALDREAKDAGVLLLNEIGLDPGIDHMSAMEIIHGVEEKGGRVVSFSSYCGGLPAPEAADNPFGYKMSWSPRGVVLAGRNSARYLKDGREVVIPGEELFAHYTLVTIDDLGKFEGYPNRDSLPYIQTYGISTTETMFRGTLRNIGWCETWEKMGKLGLTDDTVREDLDGLTFADYIAGLIKSSPGNGLREDLATHLGLDPGSEIIRRMEWLGLLSNEPLPLAKGSAVDIMAALLAKRLRYEEGERDMIILHHEFVAEYQEPKKHREKIVSTLVDYGIPGGDSSMSRTVSLPAAIAAKMILHGEITATGVRIPVSSGIYEPVMRELCNQGISFSETCQAM